MTEEVLNNSPKPERSDQIPKVLVQQPSESDKSEVVVPGSPRDANESNNIPTQNGLNGEDQQDKVLASPETGESTSTADNKDSATDQPIPVEVTTPINLQEKVEGETELEDEGLFGEALEKTKVKQEENADEPVKNEAEHELNPIIVEKQQEETENNILITVDPVADNIELQEIAVQPESITNDDTNETEENNTSTTPLLQVVVDGRYTPEAHKDESDRETLASTSEIEGSPRPLKPDPEPPSESEKESDSTKENNTNEEQIEDKSSNENEDAEANNTESLQSKLNISTTESTTHAEIASVSSVDGISHTDPYDASVSGNEDDTPEKRIGTPKEESDPSQLDDIVEDSTKVENADIESHHMEDTSQNSEKNDLTISITPSESNTELGYSNSPILLDLKIQTPEPQSERSPSPAMSPRSVHFEKSSNNSDNDYGDVMLHSQQSDNYRQIATPDIIKIEDLDSQPDNERPPTPEDIIEVVEEAKEEREEEESETDIVIEDKTVLDLETNTQSDDIRKLEEELEKVKRIKEEDEDKLKQIVQELKDENNRLQEEKEAQSQKVGDLSLQIKRMTIDNTELMRENDKKIKNLEEELLKNMEKLEKHDTPVNGTTSTSVRPEPPPPKKSSVCIIL